MTIKELIKDLSMFDPDLPVLVSGYEGGFKELLPKCIIQEKMIRDYYDAWYYGPHVVLDNYCEDEMNEKGLGTFDAVILSRGAR